MGVAKNVQLEDCRRPGKAPGSRDNEMAENAASRGDEKDAPVPSLPLVGVELTVD